MSVRRSRGEVWVSSTNRSGTLVLVLTNLSFKVPGSMDVLPGLPSNLRSTRVGNPWYLKGFLLGRFCIQDPDSHYDTLY